LTHSRI